MLKGYEPRGLPIWEFRKYQQGNIKMNQVKSFNFNQNQIQVINKDGETWFVASEIAAMFGYRDAANLTRILDDDEKGTHNVSTLGGKSEFQTAFQDYLHTES